jgi:hypothetical protein
LEEQLALIIDALAKKGEVLVIKRTSDGLNGFNLESARYLDEDNGDAAMESTNWIGTGATLPDAVEIAYFRTTHLASPEPLKTQP